MKKRLGWIAAAITVASSGPAFAATSASASLGPLTIQLVDLDDSDGVTPWITFSTTAGGQDNYIWVGTGQFGGIGDNQELHNLTPWTPISLSASVPLAQVTVSIAGPGGAAGTTLSISGHADDFHDPYPYYGPHFNAGIVGPSAGSPFGNVPQYTGSFVLSANTRAAISADATLDLAASNGGYVGADALLRVNGIGPTGVDSQSATDFLGMGSAGISNRTLAVSIENMTTGDLTGSLQVRLGVESFSYATPPVPEPETYALMLAGLLTVGSMARRRRG